MVKVRGGRNTKEWGVQDQERPGEKLTSETLPRGSQPQGGKGWRTVSAEGQELLNVTPFVPRS